MGGVDVDDRLRDRDEVDIVGRGGEVRGAMVRDGDLAGLVELDADAGGSSPPDAPASSQRTSAWPPFSCGRMYGTYWSSTLESQSPIRPPRLRSG